MHKSNGNKDQSRRARNRKNNKSYKWLIGILQPIVSGWHAVIKEWNLKMWELPIKWVLPKSNGMKFIRKWKINSKPWWVFHLSIQHNLFVGSVESVKSTKLKRMLCCKWQKEFNKPRSREEREMLRLLLAFSGKSWKEVLDTTSRKTDVNLT